MQGWLATLAIALWPLVAIYFYRALPLGMATLWTILAGQLLLPVGTAIKIAMIPLFDKATVPNLCAFVGCILVARRPPKLFASAGLIEVFIVMNLIGPLITSELNADPVPAGDHVLPPVGLYDAISAVEANFLFLIPFFLGRQYLVTATRNFEILRVLVVAGLIYSLPMLFEVRMSPQFHYWIYGYYPTDFIQSMRDGGFRPMVFMGHGLLAAFFMMTTVVAATALWRMRVATWRIPPAGISAYLGVVLVLCKTLSALVYAAVMVPLVRFSNPKLQVRVAAIFVSIALAYPTLRTFGLFPTTSIIEVASSISAERSESMKFRFENENMLLQKAAQRIWFGWGRYGRSRVYSEWGRDISTTDGHWIITLGQFGIFGFVAEFGLLSIGVFRAAAALRFAQSKAERLSLSSLALIVSINILDLLPNAGLIPWTWLLTGALVGRAEALSSVLQKRRQLGSKNNSSLVVAEIGTAKTRGNVFR